MIGIDCTFCPWQGGTVGLPHILVCVPPDLPWKGVKRQSGIEIRVSLCMSVRNAATCSSPKSNIGMWFFRSNSERIIAISFSIILRSRYLDCHRAAMADSYGIIWWGVRARIGPSLALLLSMFYVHCGLITLLFLGYILSSEFARPGNSINYRFKISPRVEIRDYGNRLNSEGMQSHRFDAV